MPKKENVGKTLTVFESHFFLASAKGCSMKKPFYVTVRKKKDGRQSLCIVFNNPATGEREKVVSASSLYKEYLGH